MKKLLIALLLQVPLFANATTLTYNFEGRFVAGNNLISAGDTLSGSYTFNTLAAQGPHGDATLNHSYNAGGLTTTGWDLTVNSTGAGTFSVSGNEIGIAVGNNTTFGDRYITTLDTTSDALPLGANLVFFQLDFQDNAFVSSPDMLDSDDVDVLPNLSDVSFAGGRFFMTGQTFGCSQCYYEITSFTGGSQSVSEPFVAFTFLLGLLGIGRRRLMQ